MGKISEVIEVKKTEKPTITQRSLAAGMDPHDVFNHPAFGTITLSNPRGGSGVLFGSDLKHRECMKIEIKRATLERSLSNDWIHGRETIAEIELSHAQFAQFITSQGNGSGTPCTVLRCAPRGGLVSEMPGIEVEETKHERLRREVEDAAKERIQGIMAGISNLEALIESGKTPKKELRDIHKELKMHASYLSGSIGFVVEQGQEALEKATSAAKIEVEAYISNAARRIGMQHLSQLGMIEDKSNDGNN